MPGKKLILLAASIFTMTLWGCGGNLDSGGDQTGASSTLEDALALGINNCLTCHSPFSSLVQDYLISRHGNHMLAAAKTANDTETPGADPSPGGCTYECHDPFNDGASIDGLLMQQTLAANPNIADDSIYNWDTEVGSIVGCEGCHGGGQFHNGIAAGIPYAVPGPAQCGLCHYLNDTLAQATAGENLYGSVPHHDTSSSGNNVRRNITDTHIDDPLTGYGLATNFVEGYAIRYDQQNGCVDCHFNGHTFDLAKNYEWAESGHAGEIKTIKDAALLAGAADAATLLANVTEAGPDDTAVFPHYDWDAANRASCAVCHTATGISNFLDDPDNYDSANNDFSHLVGWEAGVTSSGQNELLYCWGCHSDSSGTLYDPGAITLDYTFSSVAVTLPDVGNSNVCVKCHGGRGNNDSIRTGSRSSRFGGHHAPTAGSVFAATTHTGYEYTGQDYTNALFVHLDIDSPVGSGPCASCHMGSAQNHTFSATTYTSGAITHQDSSDPIVTITYEATCNTGACHNGAMVPGSLNTLKARYEAAQAVLTDYVENTSVNYVGLDLSADDPTTASTSDIYAQNTTLVPDGAYGAFQNYKYMTEEPCAYVHNSIYMKRLIFDSIDWMQDGDLDGTIDISAHASAAAAAAWLNNGDPTTAVTRP